MYNPLHTWKPKTTHKNPKTTQPKTTHKNPNNPFIFVNGLYNCLDLGILFWISILMFSTSEFPQTQKRPTKTQRPHPRYVQLLFFVPHPTTLIAAWGLGASAPRLSLAINVVPTKVGQEPEQPGNLTGDLPRHSSLPRRNIQVGAYLLSKKFKKHQKQYYYIGRDEPSAKTARGLLSEYIETSKNEVTSWRSS